MRHLQRYRQIAEVLARHGFAAAVEGLGWRRLMPGRLRDAGGGGPSHLRRALEELGPTFVKLGQLLSLRADVLPREYMEELAHLQDRVPAQPFEVSRDIIERELGRPIEQAYAHIEPEPIASASLGQVYAAWLPTGEAVVVKVLRAGVEERVRLDVGILRDLARLATERWGDSLPADPVALVEEFSRSIEREMDYRVEARHIQRFRRNFRHEPAIHIPAICPRLSTARVLTMERLSGVKVNDVEGISRLGVDRREVARSGARLFLTMVFVHHFFHGDPHPGNLLIEPDGRLGLLDYGMAASLSRETTEELVRVFLAVVRQDSRAAVRGMRRMGIVQPGTDLRALQHDLDEIVAAQYGRPLSELTLSEVVGDSLDMVRRHRMRLPAELLLLARALVLLDGLGRVLDPEFNPLEAAAPFARKLALRRFAAVKRPARAFEPLQEVAELVRTLPERADRILERAESGRLEVGVRLSGYEGAMRRLERAANRLALALVSTGLAVAGALLWNGGDGPRVLGIPVVPVALLGGAFALIAVLAWGVMRSGRL